MRRYAILLVIPLVLIPLVLFYFHSNHSVSASLNFISKWGIQEGYTGGTVNGKFNNPYDVAVDSSGNTYVLDSGNNRVQEFDNTGAYVRQWGSEGTDNGQFSSPEGIATASGKIYISDTGNNRVEEFDSSGNYLKQFGTQGSGTGQINGPMGIAVDSNGNVFVADTGNSRIEEFDSSGNYKTAITHGFSNPRGVAVDNVNNIYVADTGNLRVVEFASDGSTVLETWSTTRSPFDIVVDSVGNVYTSDNGFNVIEKHGNSGTFIKDIGAGGTTTGEFSTVNGLGIDLSDNIYAADSGNNRIEKFDSNGNYLSELGYSLPSDGNFNFPEGIAVDSSDNVYVADTLNDRIQKFDDNGTYLAQWGTPGTDSGKLNNPYALAISPLNSNVYVIDTGNNRVEEFDNSGNYVTAWGSSGTGQSEFENPQGIAVDSSGNVYVVDTNNNRVEKFDSGGNYLTQWGSGGGASGKFSGPVGIAIDSAGNVYVADSGNNRIQKFNTSGDYLSQWGGSGINLGQFSSITGIGVDKTGDVYVADSGNNRIQEFSATGAFILYSGYSGSGNGQFNNPSGVAFDSSGDIFVVDTNNNRVQKFSVSLDLGPYYSNADINFYRGDGDIRAMLIAGNTLYLGGTFGLEAVDLSTGQKMDWSPPIPRYPEDPSHTVYSLAYSDTNKILYVGTDCNLYSSCLYQYDTSTSAGTFMPDFDPEFRSNNPDDIWYSAVYALKIVGNTLYAGGSFGQILFYDTGSDSWDSYTRVGLTSFDISTPTATLTNWEQDIDMGNNVYALATSDAGLVVGGDFYQIGGVNQDSIATFDLTSGELDNSFTSGFASGSAVQALQYGNGKLYAGGTFTSVNGQTFDNLASLDEATGGANLTWAPNTQYPVDALALDGNYLYAGETESGAEGGFAEAFNVDSGNSIDWTPQDTQPVYAMLAPDSATLYAGLGQIGGSASTGNPNRNIALKNGLDLSRFIPVAYAEDLHNQTDNLLADVGGLTGTIYLAKFDAIAPTITPTDTPTPTSNSSGGGSVNAPHCGDQKPGTPSNIQLVAGPGTGQVTLSWTAPTGPVTDYSITYSDNLNTRMWGVASTGNVTTYVISNLPLNDNYYFWVNAVNGCMPGDAVDPEIHLGSTASSSYIIQTNNPAPPVVTQTHTIPAPSPLPATGPQDIIKIGGLGLIFTIIGGAILFAL